MIARILYEILHCLFFAGLTARLAACAARAPGRRALYAVAGAAGCMFLGDVYWLAHLVLRGATPTIVSACDVAYLGVLHMLNASLPHTQWRLLKKQPFAAWMGVFTVLNGVAWNVWTGAWFANLLWTVSLLLPAVRAAQLAEGGLPPARRNAFFALTGLLTLCQAMLFTPLAAEMRSVLSPICTALWALSLGLLAFALKGGSSLRELRLPAWVLLILFCEFASLLSQDLFYYAFQVLAAAAIACAAGAARREEVRPHAV